MTPESGTVPDQGGIEDRRATEATHHVEPATTTVDAANSVCPTCGHDAADLDVEAYEALKAAKNSIIRRQSVIDGYSDAFARVWTASAPTTWRRSIRSLINAGLPRSVMLECARVALDSDRIDNERKRFVYFMGVARNRIREMDGYALERMLRETS
ncbi:MAG: hypothetical protein NTX33_05900 [Propionibacteriales bacterium]|nr:hypothetical protein [Propionibacteriales bacterium]